MYELDKRSLININGAMLITLPISWIRNNRLVKGQKVSVSLDDIGQLVITPTENEHNPGIGARVPITTPTAGAQHTQGAAANANKH